MLEEEKIFFPTLSHKVRGAEMSRIFDLTETLGFSISLSLKLLQIWKSKN